MPTENIDNIIYYEKFNYKNTNAKKIFFQKVKKFTQK
jgi:hypothetical protein